MSMPAKLMVFMVFQSTLSVRRATVCGDLTLGHGIPISIHALRKESDLNIVTEQIENVKFQSTLSVRRATFDGDVKAVQSFLFQSTLSVRRATALLSCRILLHNISIHALRKESDRIHGQASPESESFQSTLSVRRATCICNHMRLQTQDFNPRSP